MAAPISSRRRYCRWNGSPGSTRQPCLDGNSGALARYLGIAPVCNFQIPLNRNHFAGTNAKAENCCRQQGSSIVPLFRYFLVMGCCLLGLLFAFDYLSPKEAAPAAKVVAAAGPVGGSLASWRQSQERLDKPQTAPVIYPDLAP